MPPAAADPFVHLHVASGFSLRYGADTPAALVRRAAELGQDTLALTDRDGLYGAVRFALACRDAGLGMALGVDLAVQPLLGSEADPAPAPGPARGGAFVPDHLPRIVLLARDRRGWASLCRLVSAAHLSGDRGNPVVRLDQVAAHADGLVLLLGPDSECGRAITARRPDLADAVLRRWQDVFGPHVRVEVVSHLVPPGASFATGDRVTPGLAGLSLPAAARMVSWALERGVPPVLTNAVRHAERGTARVVDVLDAIRRLVPISSRHLDRGNAEGHLKSGAAMRAVAEQIVAAAGYPDAAARAERWITQTGDFARSCVLDPVADLGIGSVHVPELDVVVPAGDRRPLGAAAADVLLRDRCTAELPRRYPGAVAAAARQRLEEELATITELGFGGYFLTVAEVVDLIKGMGVRVAARGSGAGSLVNHLLGISGIEPLQHGLIMERFLSPLRRALPDIDIDVESARRTEVYERILQRFGGERCTCVSMMDTYRVRHAVRDVGAALGLPPGEIDSFAKAFPHIAAREARAALAELPELRDSGLGRLAAQGHLDTFLDLVQALDGLPRHVALHPCGVLLSDATLLDRTPVEASWQGFPMSQFDKDDVEELGFLKLDVLGIRMQSAMAHAVAEIERAEGTRVDIDEIPMHDEETFRLVQEARTLGCFQIESPGQRELVGKFAPDSFGDLVTDISLFRPGPVKSDMITPFLRARHGWDVAEYLHEDLRPVLAETAGVVVFHEQVIKMVAVLTGCSLAEADEVRRTLGSPEGQREVRTWFYPTAMRRGYSLAVTERVWDVLTSFASFGFCKAHAAAFALPTYQSAWLKAHHPAAFLAGVLTHDPGMYPKRLILDDARNHGITILGLDVNRSERTYRVEPTGAGWGIRLPLAEVKGIFEAEEVAVVAGRPYATMADFWHRSGAARPTAERIVLAGGFDELHGVGRSAGPGRGLHRVTRRDLLLQLADLDRRTRSLQRGRGARRAAIAARVTDATADPRDPAQAARRQSQAPAAVRAPDELASQLALDLGDEPDGTVCASGLPEMSPAEQVRAEVEILGMDVSTHILGFYDDLLTDIGTIRARNLLRCRSDSEVLVAGVKVATQTPPVRSGRRVVFLTVDDATGPVDATFFEDVQGPYAATVFGSWLLLVRGRIRRTGPRGLSLRATGCWDLGDMRRLWLDQGLVGVQELLAAAPAPDSRPGVGVPVDPAPHGAAAGGMGQRRRVLLHASGFKLSPYADVKPAGADVKHAVPPSRGSGETTDEDAAPPAKLWHSSPGSSGW